MKLVLPYPISANRYWRSLTIGGVGRVVKSAEAKAYIKQVELLSMSLGVKRIDGPVHVHIDLYPNRPQDFAKRCRIDPDGWWYGVQCMDLDNARKVLNDALKGIAFGDDKWIKRDSGEVREPDEHGARVVVTITALVRDKIAPELAL